MKTAIATGALAVILTLAGSTVGKWTGVAMAAQRSCEQICSHSSNIPKEQCVKRCQAVRDRNATKPR